MATGFRTALGELRSAQKTAKGVSLYSRYVNRPVGRVLAATAHRVGLTPNQVTVISALFSFAGIAALAVLPPSWPLGAGVWLCLAVGFAFDSADGQLARLRGGGSPAGEWLDHLVDCAKITALHAAVLVSFHRFFDLPGDGEPLLLPLAFQLSALVTFTGGLLADKLGAGRAAGRQAGRGAEDGSVGGTGRAAEHGGLGAAPASGAAPAAAPSRLRALALLPVDYGVFCLCFSLLGDPGLFLAAYAAFFAASALFTVAFTVKWFRELNAVPAR